MLKEGYSFYHVAELFRKNTIKSDIIENNQISLNYI